MATKYQPHGSSKDSQSGRSAEGPAASASSAGVPRPEPRAGLSSDAQAAERVREETADIEDRELADLLNALNRQIAATDALINKSGMLVKTIDAHWTESPPPRRPPKFNNMPDSLPDNMRRGSEQSPGRPARGHPSAPHHPAPPKSPGKP